MYSIFHGYFIGWLVWRVGFVFWMVRRRGLTGLDTLSQLAD
jgi:hypothetical protein